MSRTFANDRFRVIHTSSTDVSFQKAAWDTAKRRENYWNAINACHLAGIEARNNLAVVGFNQEDMTCREITEPDEDVFTKINGNVLITETKVCLMAWASDCCLVALAGDGGRVVAILHASVKTFRNGVIDLAISEMRKRGVEQITAYVGICAGKCCYEYGEEDAKVDFKDWPEFIFESQAPGKVKLDLGGAVRESLKRHGAEVIRFFPESINCNICAEEGGGKFMFPSYRREHGKNGQYGMFIAKL